MAKLFIEDLSLEGKRVLMRVDLNVPVKDGKVENDSRVRASRPSIRNVLARGASLALMSHLGRSDGQRIAKYSLAPVAERLEHLLRCTAPRYEPGGGGINIGRAVHKPGGEAAVYYAAGGAALP